MAIFNREHEPPQAGEADVAYAALQAVASFVPGATQVLDLVLGSPIERRRREWLEDLADSLRRLEEERAIDLEALGRNDTFVDAVISASFAAIKTSQERKRQALRNAVLNAALSNAPDVTQQQIFLALTDRFTDRHLILLALFRSPGEWRTADGQPLQVDAAANAVAVLRAVCPDAASHPDLYHKIWSDLYAEKLVTTGAVDNGAEGDWRTIKRSTPLGSAYLKFITSPIA